MRNEAENDERLVAVSRVSNWWIAGGLGLLGLFRVARGGGALNPDLAIIAAAVTFSTIRVVADDRGLHVGFGPWGWPGRRIAPERITGVRVEQVNAWRFGGWGYRIRGRHTRVVVRSGPAVVVDLAGGATFGVTVPDAPNFAQVLAANVDQHGA